MTGTILDSFLASFSSSARFGIIGCLNVASHNAANDWLLVYVKDSSGGGTVLDANKEHTYAAVSYLDY